MIEVYNHQLFVSEEDIDMVGHVNNVVYLKWMQDAALAHSSRQGWPAERYQELGAGWVARLHQIEYLQPAFPGDCVVVQTWVSDMKKVTSTRRYRILRLTGGQDSPDNPALDTVGVDSKHQLLAVAHTQWAFIDFSSRQPKRIPPEIANAYRVIEHL